MKCYRYYESGRPIYLIIMRYNPLLSNYKADGRLQLRYRVTTDCGTFHDLLMPERYINLSMKSRWDGRYLVISCPAREVVIMDFSHLNFR